MRISLRGLLIVMALPLALTAQGEQVCLGQCLAITNPMSVPLAGGGTAQFSYSHGLYHVTQNSGVPRTIRNPNEMRAIIDNFPGLDEADKSRLLYNFMEPSLLSNSNTIQGSRERLIALDQQVEWCQSSSNRRQSFSLCSEINEEADTRRNSLKYFLARQQSYQKDCQIGRSIDQRADELLGAIKDTIASTPGQDGGRNIRIDDSVCNTASGYLGAYLQRMGYSRGEDFVMQSGRAHVFVSFPNSGKIMDPTIAQFFKPGSAAHRQLLNQENRACSHQGLDQCDGFYGTQEELKEYIRAHVRDMKQFTQFGWDDYYQACEDSERPPEQTRQECHNFIFDELIWQDIEREYYGNRRSSNNQIVNSAIRVNDRFQRRFTAMNDSSESPELITFQNNLQNMACQPSQPGRHCPNPIPDILSADFEELARQSIDLNTEGNAP